MGDEKKEKGQGSRIGKNQAQGRLFSSKGVDERVIGKVARCNSGAACRPCKRNNGTSQIVETPALGRRSGASQRKRGRTLQCGHCLRGGGANEKSIKKGNERLVPAARQG